MTSTCQHRCRFSHRHHPHNRWLQLPNDLAGQGTRLRGTRYAKNFRDIHAVLPLLIETLKHKQQQAESGEISQSTCNVLKPVLADCESKVTELSVIFEKLLSEERISEFTRGQKPALSLSQDKKVQDALNSIDRYTAVLAYHHGAVVPNAGSLRSRHLLDEHQSNLKVVSCSRSGIFRFFLFSPFGLVMNQRRGETASFKRLKDKDITVAIITITAWPTQVALI